ncbi:ABC transporter ATP-binding protein [Crenobacter intestini]|uniref:ABC transporter ATP-binding protein n=1 Tax=Crenobacter intestini TaxID=2563443 RepID=A0A4T0UXC5_9NEIS|nr:ABC transporter ATP-binding protein [Crenobacter intestini]TIC83772.1 ABC transporter ATP-binding protein [Crenobacter intestini]
MLQLTELTVRHGARTLIEHFSLTVGAGETVALLGPSGCGKSSLLRVIAGLAAPAAGRVLFAGEDITETPPERRGFSLMFQDFALFPHLDVLGNVMFGLIERRIPRRQARESAQGWLARVGLAGFETRRVWTLSGGEQQRVALARAWAVSPRALLLDEPFSALDADLRLRLGDESRRLVLGAGIPAILVTHDAAEAERLADRVIRLLAPR